MSKDNKSTDNGGIERPDRIGPYRILDTLGEGGMAVVYLAEQAEPVKRRVALKILKPGMDTKQVVARFETERQALAVLDHPNIAKVFDGGVTEMGTPYFVMERVQGIPITDYCDDNRLGTAERVRLFIDVCSAVQHAHHKGLIHRDLKPSNLLVGVVDGRPMVKVIDFGIAKAATPTLKEQTLLTKVGQVIGTPQYMSPEQADASGLDVDTRTDIYSLGVVLYELLVGIVPLDLTAIGDHAIRLALREKDPQKPSTRVTELGDTEDEIARARGTDPVTLKRQLKGDLDWIVMQAIAKDRTRRYETANALAVECRRYLSHEPVMARPPSARYVLQRFVRRNRLMVTAAAIAVVAVFAGATAATLGFIRASEAEEAAVKDAATARETTQFLVDLFQVSDPWSFSPVSNKSGTDITAREVLDKGAERIRDELQHQPEVQGGLMVAIGRVFMGLGLPEQAGPLLLDGLETRRQVYPAEHIGIGDSLLALARYYLMIGEIDQSLAVHREAISIYENAWGKDVVGLAWMLSELAVTLTHKGELNEALEVQSRALDILRTDPDPDAEVVGYALNNLGFVQNGLSLFQDAALSFEEAIDVLAETDARGQYSRALSNLSAAYLSSGRLAESQVFQEEALAIKLEWFGPDHTETAYSMANLSFIHQYFGDFEKSAALKRESIDIFSKRLGENHPNVAVILGSLGMDLTLQGRYDDAERTLFEARDRFRNSLGPDSMREPSVLNSVGELYAAQGRNEEAETQFRESLRILAAANVQHMETGRAMGGIADLPESTLSTKEREQYFNDSIGILRDTSGLGTPEAALVQMNFGAFLFEQGDESRAREFFQAGLNHMAAALPVENPRYVKQAKRYENLFGEPPPPL